MTSIHITTFIQAPVERVFDLARNITMLKSTLNGTAVHASSGGSSYLFQPGDIITYQSKNLGRNRTVTARITEMNRPASFTEEQVKGDLKSYSHSHHFKHTENGTIMIDLIECEGPRDWLGSLAGSLYLKKYLEKLTRKRIAMIRQYAESEKWKAVLEGML